MNKIEIRARLQAAIAALQQADSDVDGALGGIPTDDVNAPTSAGEVTIRQNGMVTIDTTKRTRLVGDELKKGWPGHVLASAPTTCRRCGGSGVEPM